MFKARLQAAQGGKQDKEGERSWAETSAAAHYTQSERLGKYLSVYSRSKNYISSLTDIPWIMGKPDIEPAHQNLKPSLQKMKVIYSNVNGC